MPRKTRAKKRAAKKEAPKPEKPADEKPEEKVAADKTAGQKIEAETPEPEPAPAPPPADEITSREEITGKEGVRMTCPKCHKAFVIADNEEVRCKNCGVAIFECSECGGLIDETMTECPRCRAKFEGIEQVHEEMTVSKTIACASCHFELSEDNRTHICASCGRSFCDRCMGHHIPPEHNRLEVKITYQYKIKERNFWESSTTKLGWSIPTPLCPDCYEKEFFKGVQKLREMVKGWKNDQMHEMSIKIVKEEYPQGEMMEKLKLVESAQQFLKTLGRKE